MTERTYISRKGAFRAPRSAVSCTRGYRDLAAAVLADAITFLRKPCPARQSQQAAFEVYRNREIAFFRDPRRSAKWCEMAGFDHAAIVSKLEKEGLLASRPAAPDIEAVRPPRTPSTPVELMRFRGRVLQKLPRKAQYACTVNDLTDSLGVPRTNVARMLEALERDGRAAHVGSGHRTNARKWFRVERAA